MNKEEILLEIKKIQCSYSLPLLEINFNDKDYAIKQYENLIICLAEKIERLNSIIKECANDILKELKENNHLSYGVALAIRQKLIDGIKRAFNCEYETGCYTNEMIKSVVTKEQFESIQYEVFK